MNLPFSQTINGKPTHFVEKIRKGIQKGALLLSGVPDWTEAENKIYPLDNSILEKSVSKIHTIREDKNDRWKEGNQIHFTINMRTKRQLQFAPVLPVVSTQKIEIQWKPIDGKKYIFIWINDQEITEDTDCYMLARNDGFESWPEFCQYFNKNFIGKIIHWTKFTY